MTNRKVIVARAQHAHLPPIGYIRASDLFPGIIPVTRATGYAWVSKGTFPKPVKLGPATSAWRCEDVHKWMEAHK